MKRHRVLAVAGIGVGSHVKQEAGRALVAAHTGLKQRRVVLGRHLGWVRRVLVDLACGWFVIAEGGCKSTGHRGEHQA